MDKIKIPATSAIAAQIEIVLESGYSPDISQYGPDRTISLTELLHEYRRLTKLEYYYKMAFNTLDGALTRVKEFREETLTQLRNEIGKGGEKNDKK